MSEEENARLRSTILKLHRKIERLEEALRDRQGHCDFCGLAHDFGVSAHVDGKHGAEACRLRAEVEQNSDDEGVDPYNCGIGGAMDRALREEGK